MFDAITGNDKVLEAEEQKKERDERLAHLESSTDLTEEEPPKLTEFITAEHMIEVMGGKEVVESEKRLSDMIWQSRLILDNKIMLQDFIYILQFTDTVEQ